MTNISASECFGLKVIDIQHHHKCFNWTETRVDCEAEWPCEVRLYLVDLSPFISLTRAFLSYGTVVIIVLGILLNVLSFYTLVSSGLAKNGSGIYLVTLAICDCGNLMLNYTIGVARGHIPAVSNYFLKLEWLCRSHGVFVEVFQLNSAWIVVSFTIERCIAVWHPLLMRKTSRTRRARTIVICVTSVLTFFSLTKLFLTGFESDSVFGYAPCQSHRFRWQGMSYVRVAFQTWIPTILVFVFNCLMFFKLRKRKQARERLNAHKPPTRGPALNQQNGRRPSFMSKPSPTAPMLVAVSLTYLVLVFPLGAVQTIELFWNVHPKHPVYETIGGNVLRQQYIQWKKSKLLLKYLRSFFFGFYQINFAINFFLYFAAGQQFRLHLEHKINKVLQRLNVSYFPCCQRTNNDESSTAENSQRTTSISLTTTTTGSSVNRGLEEHSNIEDIESVVATL